MTIDVPINGTGMTWDGGKLTLDFITANRENSAMVPPKQYKQSPIRTATNLITAVVSAASFCFFAVFGFATDGAWKWVWIALACAFGLIAIVLGGLVARPLRLTLDSSGFSLLGGWMRSPRFVAWRDIDGPMSCYSIGRGQGAIGYNFVEGANDGIRRTAYMQDHFLPDANLPDVWRDGGQQLADELNAYRAQALGDGN